MKQALRLVPFVAGGRVPTKVGGAREGLRMKHAVRQIPFVARGRVPTKVGGVREHCA